MPSPGQSRSRSGREGRDDDAPRSLLGEALRANRGVVVHLFVIGLLLNLFGLATPLYTMEIFNRVASTRSMPTLIGLVIPFLLACGLVAALAAIRGAILRRLGVALDEAVSAKVFDALYVHALQTGRFDRIGVLRDFETVRRVWSSAGLTALLDLPFFPIYLVIAFYFHTVLGIALIVGILVSALLVLVSDIASRYPLRAASLAGARADSLLGSVSREAEVVGSLGMTRPFAEKWYAALRGSLAWRERVSHITHDIKYATKFWQYLVSYGMIGLAAYLTLQGNLSSGAMFAMMFLGSMAVGTFRGAAAQLHQIAEARQAMQRVDAALDALRDFDSRRLTLPRPRGTIEVAGLSYGTGTGTRLIVRDVSFSLPPGSTLAVIGPSGAGKSTLVRLLVGLIRPSLGSVRLDGAELQHWDADALGRHLGYLPQEVELMSGTIAENIARFGVAEDEAVREAARRAGVHEAIEALPAGYRTMIDQMGAGLSGGQKQRIGLARALYGDPTLVLLDEPNSNLDATGETALSDAIALLKEARTTCIVISHKANILGLADYVLVLKGGGVSRPQGGDSARRVIPARSGDRRPVSEIGPRMTEEPRLQASRAEPSRSTYDAAIGAQWPAVAHAAVITLFMSVSVIAGSVFAEQVYDRVLVHKRVETLVVLAMILVLVLLTAAFIEKFRDEVLARASLQIEERARRPLFSLRLRAELGQVEGGKSAMADLDAVRGFVGGGGLSAFLDAIPLPLLVGACFAMHVVLGLCALFGATILVLVTVAQIKARQSEEHLKAKGRTDVELLVETLANAASIQSLGMRQSFRKRWLDLHRSELSARVESEDRQARYTSSAQFLSQTLSGLCMAVAAYLAIHDEISPGNMIGVMIIASRLLGPLSGLTAQWPSAMAARRAHRRLRTLFRAVDTGSPPGFPGVPSGALSVRNISVTAPGGKVPILRDISFDVPAGSVVAVIGPSGAGKSTLVRALIGAWRPKAGRIALDGVDLATTDPEAVGPHLGYLPQAINFLPGTIAENIARFGPTDDDAVLRAAQLARVHDVIQGFEHGYNTQVGEGGVMLSGGQRQRVALARAIYGEPALVVLDEPNSNLDALGEAALSDAVRSLKARGTTCFIITHKANILTLADLILVIRDGALSRFGPREDILSETKTVRAVTPGTPASELSA